MTSLRRALFSALLLAAGCEAIASFDRDKLDPMTAPSVVIPARDGGVRPGDGGADGAVEDADVADADSADADAEPAQDAESSDEGGTDAAAEDASGDADLADAATDGATESDGGDDAGDAG